LTGGAAAKHWAISSSALANSEGRRAGNPKHSFPASMAGSQKQPFSTGRQRNAVTGRPARVPSRPKPVPSDRCVLLSTRSTGRDLNRSEAARIFLARWHRNPIGADGLSRHGRFESYVQLRARPSRRVSFVASIPELDFSQTHFVRTQRCSIVGSSRERGGASV